MSPLWEVLKGSRTVWCDVSTFESVDTNEATATSSASPCVASMFNVRGKYGALLQCQWRGAQWGLGGVMNKSHVAERLRCPSKLLALWPRLVLCPCCTWERWRWSTAIRPAYFHQNTHLTYVHPLHTSRHVHKVFHIPGGWLLRCSPWYKLLPATETHHDYYENIVKHSLRQSYLMRSLLYHLWLIDCVSPQLPTLYLTSCVTNMCRCSPETIFYVKSINPCELADILSACLLHERGEKKSGLRAREGMKKKRKKGQWRKGRKEIPSPIPSLSVSICETEKRKRRLGAALKALKKPRSPPGQICEMRKWLRGQKAGGR